MNNIIPARLAATLSLALATGLFSLPAWALQSDWAATEGARMRIVLDSAPDSDGLLRGALEIDLEEGWKTYWKDPGGSGIPPTIDTSESSGIELMAVRFPAPVRVKDEYSEWAGYEHPVQFALEFRAAAAAELKADVFIGICKTICVPFQAEFELAVPDPATAAQIDPEAEAVIEEAFLNLPDQPVSDFAISIARFDRDAGQIDVNVRLPEHIDDGAAPELFVAGPPGWSLAPPERTKWEAGEARFSVRVVGMPMDPAVRSQPLDFVITLGQRAIEDRIKID